MVTSRSGILLQSVTQSEYVVGLDLGQTTDPTAISVIELRTTLERRREWDGRPQERATDRELACRHLERLPLRMSYPDQIVHVRQLLQRAPLRGNHTLVIDQTGVGRPVVDMFREAGLQPEPVTITAGDSETCDRGDWRVAKILLVSRLQALLHSGELRIADELPEATTLKAELQDFRASISDQTGYASFGARVGAHDDLVLATAIACWWACRPRRVIDPSKFLPWYH